MDTETFKKVFLSYHRKLYRIAYRMLQDTSNAEDVLQETYIKLWNKRDELENVDNTEAFAIMKDTARRLKSNTATPKQNSTKP